MTSDEKIGKTDDRIILCHKYSPDHLRAAEKFIEKCLHQTVVVEIRIETIVGEANRS